MDGGRPEGTRRHTCERRPKLALVHLLPIARVGLVTNFGAAMVVVVLVVAVAITVTSMVTSTLAIMASVIILE